MDWSKLSPAPWANITIHGHCELAHNHHTGGECDYRVVTEHGGHDIYATPPADGDAYKDGGWSLVCGTWDYECGGVCNQADAEFIALARNAFDVMMRRKTWHVMWWTGNANAFFVSYVNPNDAPPSTWNKMGKWKAPGPFVIPLEVQEKAMWQDPFTALVEADRWYKENVEAVREP